MADKEFTIADELAVHGAHLLISAYTTGMSQLSKKKVTITRQLNRVRFHVQCIIGQLRKILDTSECSIKLV